MNQQETTMTKHPNYNIPAHSTSDNSARCRCGGILYWHAPVEGGGCEDCECPEFAPSKGDA